MALGIITKHLLIYHLEEIYHDKKMYLKIIITLHRWVVGSKLVEPSNYCVVSGKKWEIFTRHFFLLGEES